MTSHLEHIDRLHAARRAGTLSADNTARFVDPSGTFATHLLTSPYFFVGPKRVRSLDAIRIVCEREQRNPVEGEVITLSTTSTRIIAVSPSSWPNRLSVTFTCSGAEDIVRSAGIVLDRETLEA